MQKTLITPDLELEIIEFYKTHTVLNTSNHFHISRYYIMKILANHKIAKHSFEQQAMFANTQYEETMLAKYGVRNASYSEEFKDKRTKTLLDRYGVENAFQAEEFKDKIKQTCLERYGVENIGKSQMHVEMRKKTCLERYGVENPQQVKEIKQKTQQTVLDRYGVLHLGHKTSYFYHNERFDSFPELCFYMYYYEHAADISHEPIVLTYEFEGELHYYHPDFSLAGELYELKGPHLVNDLGEWINPFNENLSASAEAKHQCAIANHVKILYAVDYQKYIDWFEKSGYNKDDFKI